MDKEIQSIIEPKSAGLFGDELNIDFRHYLRIIRKNRMLIIVLTSIVTAIAAYNAYTATPIFKSTATLLIESQKANVVSIEEIYGFDGQNAEYYLTQFELLKSRALAEKVIDLLKLQDHPVYNKIASADLLSISSLKQWVKDIELPGQGGGENSTVGEFLSNLIEKTKHTIKGDDSPIMSQVGDQQSPETKEKQRRQSLISSFVGSLTIEPIRRTKLVKISFTSSDPKLAAQVANAVGETYIESYLDAKMEMTEKAAQWLADRLGGLRLKLASSEKKLIDFREKHQLIDFNGGVGTLTEQQIQFATSELSKSNSELSKIASLRDEVLRLQTDSPELLDTIPIIQQDALVRTYKVEQDEQNRILDELSNRYGAKHPKIIDVKSRLNVVTNNLNEQINRVIATIQKDYELAAKNVESLNETLSSSKREIQDVNKKKFELTSLEREVEANRKLYDTFFNRIRETDEADGLEAANARVSDRAIEPRGAFKPKKSLIIALAAIAGLIGSILLAFLRENMDDTVKGADEVESRLGVPMLGIIPLIKNGLLRRKSAIPLSPYEIPDKHGTFVESIRTIRTSLCLDNPNNPHKKVVITSSIPSEGKSTLAINLAYSLSQIEKVILIDADMRKPTVGKAFGIDSVHPGLSDYLKAKTRKKAVHISECIIRNLNDGNLDVLPCGSIPSNPLELLASPRFSRLFDKLADHYDRIIVDCAPTQAVSDALVLGKQSDALIYVIKSHSTKLHLIQRGLKRIRQAGIHILGATVTQVDVDKLASYGGDYYYQGYYDYYGYSKNHRKSKQRNNTSMTAEFESS